jgi:hypothetical protein
MMNDTFQSSGATRERPRDLGLEPLGEDLSPATTSKSSNQSAMTLIARV